MDNQVTQTKTDLQQPRNDLQPTTNALQQGGEVTGSSNALTQEQLNSNQLRVGDSNATVQNTTSATPYKAESHFSSVWLWLILFVVGLAVLVIAMRRRLPPVEAIEPAQDGPDIGVPKPKRTKQKPKQTGKTRTTAKRKHQR